MAVEPVILKQRIPVAENTVFADDAFTEAVGRRSPIVVNGERVGFGIIREITSCDWFGQEYLELSIEVGPDISAAAYEQIRTIVGR